MTMTKTTNRMMIREYLILSQGLLFFVVTFLILVCVRSELDADATTSDLLKSDEDSYAERETLTRNLVVRTNPTNPLIVRKSYVHTEKQEQEQRQEQSPPDVCLALLSCCQRIDLLNHTLAGVIRHMEEDEPSFLRYEIAWVDNGSSEELTQSIVDSYQIEHALRIPKNMGLAYGMNVLVQNLCRAPYILLLEEDWLYLDELVATQTEQRRRSIATAVALMENLKDNNVTAFDGRNVMGVFFRPETYEKILLFPFSDIWETRQSIDLAAELPNHQSMQQQKVKQADETHRENQQAFPQCGGAECRDGDGDDGTVGTIVTDIDYKIFCSDTIFRNSYIWGSYTNGAGMYRRDDLMKVGRMYGEPGDAFHDRYVEGNFAYRAGLRNCQAAIRLVDDKSCNTVDNKKCTAAFHHIGGGRGTRPMSTKGTVCEDQAWNLFGTPLYRKLIKFQQLNNRSQGLTCTKEDLVKLQQQKFKDSDADEYRRAVKASNEQVFEREREHRDGLRRRANIMLKYLKIDPAALRQSQEWLAKMSDEEIEQFAYRILKLADSPHPMDGFWDSHGRIIDEK